MSEVPDKIDLSNKEHVDLVLKEFEKLITDNQKMREDFRQRMQNARQGQIPTLKQFYALAALVHYQHIETLDMLESYFKGFVEMDKDIREKTEKLQKEIDQISKETGINLNGIKEKVAEMKEQMEAPIYKYVKEQEANAEKKKKIEDEILDWAIRSR